MKDDMPVECINRLLLVSEEGILHAARAFIKNTTIGNAGGMHVNLIRGQSIGICCLNNWRPGIQPVLKLGPNQNKVTQRQDVHVLNSKQEKYLIEGECAS